MKKIVIVGCGGAGKSTLAQQLGKLLGLPVIHLDAVFWKAGWRIIAREEQKKALQTMLGGESWIIDGNYRSTMAIRFTAADTIIFLDFHPLLCLWRVLKRYKHYRGSTRPDMSEGCLEKVDWQFIGWILSYRQLYRPMVLKQLAEQTGHRSIVILKHPKQVDAFLKQLT